MVYNAQRYTTAVLIPTKTAQKYSKHHIIEKEPVATGQQNNTYQCLRRVDSLSQIPRNTFPHKQISDSRIHTPDASLQLLLDLFPLLKQTIFTQSWSLINYSYKHTLTILSYLHSNTLYINNYLQGQTTELGQNITLCSQAETQHTTKS